jgi:hypothetical protein
MPRKLNPEGYISISFSLGGVRFTRKYPISMTLPQLRTMIEDLESHGIPYDMLELYPDGKPCISRSKEDVF